MFEKNSSTIKNTLSIVYVFKLYMSLSCICLQVQPIPLGVTISNAVSKLKAQSSKLKARTSLFTETWQKRRSSFEL